MPLKLGTRGSRLALKQCVKVLERLETKGIKAKKEIVTTSGDVSQKNLIHEIEGKGAFVKEIDSLVLKGKLDGGVHSMKDIPSDLPPGLTIAAIPQRNSPYDLLLTRQGTSFEELPKGAIVGTSAVRRRAQLLWHRSDLSIRKLRGNIDTRIDKLKDGKYEGIVIAEAGIKRLNLAVSRACRLPFVPSANQGAIAVTARADSKAAHLLNGINHTQTRLETEVERIILNEIGEGCALPLGVLVQKQNGKLEIRAQILIPNGENEYSKTMQISTEGYKKKAKEIGKELLDWKEKHT